MARDILQTVALVDDDDGISVSASPGAGAIVMGGALVSGGVAYIYSATGSPATRMGQIVTVTSGGNDAGITFTITGTDADGRVMSQTITGGNVAAASTTRYFSTVTAVTKSGASAGTVKVGVIITNGGVTRSARANNRAPWFGVGMGLTVSGTITCTVQHTFADINDATWVRTWYSNSGMTAKTANTDGNYIVPIMGIRLLVVPTSTATAYLEIVGS